MRKHAHTLLLVVLAHSMSAYAFTRGDHLTWLKTNQSTSPQFIVGDTITYENAVLIRSFILMKQQDSLIAEGMEMKIVEPSDLSSRAQPKVASHFA